MSNKPHDKCQAREDQSVSQEDIHQPRSSLQPVVTDAVERASKTLCRFLCSDLAISAGRCLEGGVNLAEADQIGRRVFEEASSRQAQSTQMEMARLRVQMSAAIPDVRGDGFSPSRHKLRARKSKFGACLLPEFFQKTDL